MVAELEEEFYETNRTKLLRWVPWLHLFRAFRIALDVRKIVLGAVAAFLLSIGNQALDALPFAPAPQLRNRSAPEQRWWQPDEPVPLPGYRGDQGRFPSQRTSFTAWFASPWLRPLFPLETIIEPGARIFARRNSWADLADAWTRLLFRLALWALFGGAIARIAAVQFATHQGITARSAIGYTATRFLSIIGAPLLPLVFIGFFWFISAAVGLIGRLPGIGPIVAGVLWFLPLLAGLALAVVLLVIAVGWPLMVATISAEGTDAFDGLSRAYDYLLNRTWYALWLVLLSVLYGAITIYFVSAVAQAGVHLAYWGAASGMGENRVAALQPSTIRLLDDPMAIAPPSQAPLGAVLATGWIRVISWLVWGFVVSYFWTAVTLIYFLLRHSLDSRPLDHVYVPPNGSTSQGPPLSGIPAAERRERELQSGQQDSAGDGTDAPGTGAS